VQQAGVPAEMARTKEMGRRVDQAAHSVACVL